MKNFSFFLIFFLVSLTMNAQHVVSGKVLNIDNEPLIGATVLEKGTDNGVITNFDGTYSIGVTNADAILIVSYVGHETSETAIKGAENLDIILIQGLGLKEILLVGSRSQNRTSVNSAVPIDVIDVAEIANNNGQIEINQVLQYAAPSFNATKQTGSDGADHIVPASLRGLGPDQTLVLINGKRRHQTSLINIFGTRGLGNTGTDLNAIPASAIKRIEVLRDGASAQYGSDAIAGVINIVLKDQTDGVTGGISYGAYSTAYGKGFAEEVGDEVFNAEGENRALDSGGNKKYDGNTTRVDLNYGIALGDKGGFANFTFEYLTREKTLRPGFSFRQGFGSASIDQGQFMFNIGYPITENTKLYAFGGRGIREGDAFAFSRGAPGADGDSRSVTSLYPNGFTPRIASNIQDNSVTGGIRHEYDNGWIADFSHSYGINDFHYFIKGTNNATLGAASPTEFDAGGHNLSMNVTNLDFSKYFESVAAGLNIAFGTEYRYENFEIFAGEEGSYASYDVNGVAITDATSQTPFLNEFGQQPSGGSQGFPGYSPENEVNRNRSNFGLYIDAELNTSEKFLVSLAARYENYSDFGSTVNAKLATRYQILEGFAWRMSASTGFRAPSLAQIHYNLVFNNIVGGTSLRTLLASNTSTVTRAFGIESLQEEKALNFATGLTFRYGNFSTTIDGYIINVNDRIVLTDVFDATGLDVGAEAAQFFVNGVDTRTSGLDIVMNYKHNFSGNNHSLSLGGAANFNKTEITNINNKNLNEFTFFGPYSRAFLETAAPDYKFTLSANYAKGKFDVSVNWTQFSQVEIKDFQFVDTPVTTQAEADALSLVATDVYKAVGTLDVSIGYELSSSLNLRIGGNNLLNTYPTPQFDFWTGSGGFSDPVQIGNDGQYLFTRLGFKF